MGKWIRRAIMLLMLVVFCVSGFIIYKVNRQYKEEEQLYLNAADSYTSRVPEGTGTQPSGGKEDASGENGAEDDNAEYAPVTVDFESLMAEGEDVVAWIYCPDTAIDYPVVKGEDNSFYLSHSFDGSSLKAGAIFIDANDRDGFTDANMIIYGHHMNDGSMFAGLHSWMEEGYYEEHPVMWILTPEQDYKVLIFSGYNTPAVSDTYKIFHEPCPELNEYLSKCAAQSDFETGIEPDGKGKYVVLSTCSYVFEDARYVLHGVMVPVNKRP